MEHPKYKIALIVGAGEGLSASLARLLSAQGIRVALAARKIEKLGALCSETGAKAYACNATEPDEVERLFGLVEREIGTPDLVVYNASGRTRHSIPFFCNCDYDAVVECITACTAGAEGDDGGVGPDPAESKWIPKYPPVKAGEYILAKLGLMREEDDNIERNADAKDGSRALPSSSGEPVVSSHGSRSDGPVAPPMSLCRNTTTSLKREREK